MKTIRKSRGMSGEEVSLNNQNNKENQQFNTFDVLSIFLCFMLVVGIGSMLFMGHLNEKKRSIAKNYVENLAQELIMKPVNSSMKMGGRLPASAENQELDPWGVAYKYSIVKNSYGQPIYVVVLSGGPNNRFETEISEVVSFSHSSIENVKFEGDDIGYIKSFR